MSKSISTAVYCSLLSSLCSLLLVGVVIKQNADRFAISSADRQEILRDTAAVNAKLDALSQEGATRGLTQQETYQLVRKIELLLTNVEGKLDE